jgi:hypothetical protein
MISSFSNGQSLYFSTKESSRNEGHFQGWTAKTLVEHRGAAMVGIGST